MSAEGALGFVVRSGSQYIRKGPGKRPKREVESFESPLVRY